LSEVACFGMELATLGDELRSIIGKQGTITGCLRTLATSSAPFAPDQRVLGYDGRAFALEHRARAGE